MGKGAEWNRNQATPNSGASSIRTTERASISLHLEAEEYIQDRLYLEPSCTLRRAERWEECEDHRCEHSRHLYGKVQMDDGLIRKRKIRDQRDQTFESAPREETSGCRPSKRVSVDVRSGLSESCSD